MRSFKRSPRGRLMKIRIGKDGYPRVTLQDAEGDKIVERVHLIVAEAFLGPAKGRIIRHLDGDRENAKLNNLECFTQHPILKIYP